MLLLCIKIFLVRILDVSLGTIRTIITIKEKNLIASLIGFVEILIWFLIAREAINDSNNSILVAISYALGFATGTYIGGLFASKIVNTNLTVQIISEKADELIEVLKKYNYGITVLNINNKNNSFSKMLALEINMKKLKDLRGLINSIDNKAFITINETKYVYNGYLGN